VTGLDTLDPVTTVLVLNGPNLGRLGSREPDVYGDGTLEELRAQLSAESSGLTIDLRQTDDEAMRQRW
jgi:3-dehydroquinate dehydratase II